MVNISPFKNMKTEGARKGAAGRWKREREAGRGPDFAAAARARPGMSQGPQAPRGGRRPGL